MSSNAVKTMVMTVIAAGILSVGSLAMAESGNGGATLPKDANTTCPVMTKEEVDPDIHVEYKGETIYMCCAKCKKRFNENPDKYLKRLHKADGQTTASAKKAKSESK